jgi:hypothetical protein
VSFEVTLRWTWILVVTQLLSFLGVVFVIEPRRVRTLMDKMDKLLTDHEATVSDQVSEWCLPSYWSLCIIY